ncbi:TetR/AcrR family transcriptional regulator [Sphingobium sp. CCH11-B1]|jgi:AcrR family transcriptional regulator|uniref:TetR/AcrR family transcriptional regulator n=1 Tax=Sphingobium sp. CCH11-B1 TaxID=1768781 RepID=UPI000837416B|nr:TetR/AcrR family transcriptional regulator [Sphingobium sp. CCH11-B1]MEA3387848.1 TetR/AcrR family transcriptional regulator [Pseudomonadota bacterium]
MPEGDRSQAAAPLHDRLVDCALALLERGEADVSLRAVARAAGVSAMAPYRHFSDKSALMAAVALRGFAMMEAEAANADRGDDAAAALTAQGLSYIAFARAHPALFRLMFADDAGMTLPHDNCKGGYALMARRVEQLAPDRAEAGALACWGLVHGLATLALDGRLPPDPAGERAALDLMARALAARA